MKPDRLSAHAIERALERYGIVLTHADMRALEQRVREGMLLRKAPDGAEMWVIRIGEQLATVVFYGERIKTFLPPDKPMASRARRFRITREVDYDGWRRARR